MRDHHVMAGGGNVFGTPTHWIDNLVPRNFFAHVMEVLERYAPEAPNVDFVRRIISDLGARLTSPHSLHEMESVAGINWLRSMRFMLLSVISEMRGRGWPESDVETLETLVTIIEEIIQEEVKPSDLVEVYLTSLER